MELIPPHRVVTGWSRPASALRYWAPHDSARAADSLAALPATWQPRTQMRTSVLPIAFPFRS
jgi:hypothetical protein